MTKTTIRIFCIAMVAAVASCAPAKKIYNLPTRDLQRISSTTGFSFLPPQADGWSEEAGQGPNQVLYFKQTDLKEVSFYAGALEGQLAPTFSDEEAFVEFVQSKKDVWGDDKRFADVASQFYIEDEQRSCVRYSLSAKDGHANNIGPHAYMVMLAAGRFCQHPSNKTSSVDIYYSVRHAPNYEVTDLVAEGEAFLNGLEFARLPPKPSTKAPQVSGVGPNNSFKPKPLRGSA